MRGEVPWDNPRPIQPPSPNWPGSDQPARRLLREARRRSAEQSKEWKENASPAAGIHAMGQSRCSKHDD